MAAQSREAEGTKLFPLYPSSKFVGRVKELHDLHEIMSKETGSSRCAVLRALGGQGKSRLAAEYCVQNRDTLKTILWINAQDLVSIQRSFKDFYNKFNRPLEDIDAIVSSVIGSFDRSSSPWLIVFDNYDDPENVDIQSYMPINANGSILITTRHANLTTWETQGYIELAPLEQRDAIELFLRSAEIQTTQAACAAAVEVVACLSYHALAIRQAGRFWRKKRRPVDQFVKYYESHKRELLSKKLNDVDYKRRSTDDGSSLDVFTTWELSLQQISEPQDTKIDLLTALGCWHGRTVEEQALESFCNNSKNSEVEQISASSYLAAALQQGWNHEDYVEHVSEFLDLGLITELHVDRLFGHTISFHPLVRDWIRLRIPKEMARQYQRLMLRVLVRRR